MTIDIRHLRDLQLVCYRKTEHNQPSCYGSAPKPEESEQKVLHTLQLMLHDDVLSYDTR